MAREQQRPGWTVKSFRETLSKEIRILEQGVFTPGAHLQTSDSPMVTAFSLHVGTNAETKVDLTRVKPLKVYMCIVRAHTHTLTPNHCDVVSSIGKCVAHIKKEGLCFNCLGKHKVNCVHHKLAARNVVANITLAFAIQGKTYSTY